ncbi:MAG: cysteine desulfurase [Amphibacillus sp.]|nr:cysteine desulfurase [Amphibacillus sp.]
MEPIYLDHAATTPMHPNVIKAMQEVMGEVYGNPSSIHQFGRRARAILDENRRYLAQSIGADEKELYFTSGGTEADNLALIGVALANQHKGNHIITTAIEHHANIHAAEHLESLGFEVTYLPVNEAGYVQPSDVVKQLRPDTILVSVMMINNEVGTIQPIEEIANVLKDHQAYFHTDAVQAYGLIKLDVKQLGVDLMSASAHKLNGPKGVGFLYAQQDVKFNALQHGGNQERLKRPGTESLPGIVGMRVAIEQIEANNYQNYDKYKLYRDLFYKELQQSGIEFSVNGKFEELAPTILNISFANTSVEQMLMSLDLEGVAVSSGSACTAGSIEASHVLTAMYGSDHPKTKNSIRFSFGFANDEAQMIEAAKRVINVVKRLTK